MRTIRERLSLSPESKNSDWRVLARDARRTGGNEKRYETGTKWHRVYAWQGLSKYARTLQKGQFIILEGTLRHREVEAEGQPKQRLAKIHATSMTRLSNIEDTDDPHDGAGEE